MIRLRPFTEDSDNGRRSERYRRAALSLAANVVSKLAALVLMLLSISLTLPYLGAERFGIWATIAAFTSILTFLDFGIGNALIGHVARAAARNHQADVRKTVTGGLGVLLLLAAATSLVLTVAAASLPWPALIKVNDPSLHDEIRRAGVVFAILFGPVLVAGSVHRVMAGLQLSFLGHAASTAGSLLGIPLLIWASQEQASIPLLVGLTLSMQAATGTCLLGYLSAKHVFVWTSLKASIKAFGFPILGKGWPFLLLHLGTVVGWGADNLIISSTLGAAQVAAYAIVQRLFQFVSQPLAMINAPLWAAYADADSRGDKKFLRATLTASLKFSALAAAGLTLILLVASPWLIPTLARGTVVVPAALLLTVAFWVCIDAVGNAFAMFLNGCAVIREQVVTAMILLVLALPLKLWAVSQLGVVGMVTSYSLVYLGVVISMYGFVYRLRLRDVLI